MNNPLYNDFAARFAADSIQSLIAHDMALIHELVRRGIDISAVSDGHATSFARRVALEDNRLVIAQ